MIQILAFSFLISISPSRALDLLNSEPDIQCTVIKVIQKEKLGSIKDFPSLYQSLSNDPNTSRLYIAGKEFAGINPKTLIKTSNFEKIAIVAGRESIILELHGVPISRNGKLEINGKHIADLTCH